jgi:hypothetical protein
MFQYGKRVLTERFGQVSALFGLGLSIMSASAANVRSAILRPLFSTLAMVKFHQLIHEHPSTSFGTIACPALEANSRS